MGSYAAGTPVTIAANAPALYGPSFLDWTDATVANATASTTTLTMPAANTTVTANYTTAVAKYTLTVVNGSGSGSYAAGTAVTITANALLEQANGFQFGPELLVANANTPVQR